MTNQKSTPMYFASLEIENIKCFKEKQTLNLRDSKGALSRWTLILGDNGLGKTTLLKCLAWMIPVEETDKAKAEINIPDSMIAIKPFMDGFEKESDYEQLVRVGEKVQSRVGATFTNGLTLGSTSSDNQIAHAINIFTSNGKLDDIKVEHGQLSEFNSPSVYAYSASRHMAFKNFDKSELKDNSSNLFSESGDLYDADQLLSILDTAAIRQKGEGKATDLLKKVKQILSDLLPEIKKPEDIIINSPLNEDGSTNDNLVEIQTHDGKVPLFNLSLGYQTMLAWSVDLALRMLWNNPESADPLKEPAVVIVDEIDLHLHPKWQRTVREHLTFHFPNVQFICTAHSPFMAQDSEDENLCVIKRVGDKAQIENEPLIVKGWRIGQIATSDLFDLPSERSPDLEKDTNNRRFLIGKQNLDEKDEADLKNLDEKFSKLPVEINIEKEQDQELLDQILKTAELLRKEGKLK